VIDGVKVAKKDEQKVISEMKRLKTRGKSYRYIASWLKAKKDIEMSFMGVRSIILTR
jgi:hypothetical protein